MLETVIKLRWAPDIIHCHGWLTALVPLYIRKYYHDDPLFAQSKVVYSVYDDEFAGALNKNFRKKLLLKGISGADVKVLENPTYVNVSKLAVQYADAVVKGSREIHPELGQFIGESGKKFLDYQEKEVYIDAYNDFYDKV